MTSALGPGMRVMWAGPDPSTVGAMSLYPVPPIDRASVYTVHHIEPSAHGIFCPLCSSRDYLYTVEHWGPDAVGASVCCWRPTGGEATLEALRRTAENSIILVNTTQKELAA